MTGLTLLFMASHPCWFILCSILPYRSVISHFILLHFQVQIQFIGCVSEAMMLAQPGLQCLAWRTSHTSPHWRVEKGVGQSLLPEPARPASVTGSVLHSITFLRVVRSAPSTELDSVIFPNRNGPIVIQTNTGQLPPGAELLLLHKYVVATCR